MGSRILLPALVVLLAGAGCASYGSRMGPAIRAMSSGDFQKAVEALEKKPDPESVVWQMEHGLLLRYAGRLEESNQAFAEAVRIQEDLYTRSVTNEAAALAVSDAIRPYRAPDFELGFLHAYPALNYLEMGDLSGAMVEARALSELLELRSVPAEEGEEEKAGDWALGRHLVGLIYEAGGELNDAWISYRAALRLYRSVPPRGWEALEEELVGSILRTGARLGLREPDELYGSDAGRADRLRSALAEAGHQAGAAGADQGAGAAGAGLSERPHRPARLVVWQEEGLVPVKEDVHIRVPILKEEENWGNDRIDHWSRRVGERSLAVHHGHYHSRDVKIAYLLDVALPVLSDPLPRPPLEGAVRVNGNLAGTVPEAEDVSAEVREDLDRRYPGIAVRAAARAIIKALATRGARQEGGEVAGVLTNILGAATERADTRGWATLPARIGLTVVEVEPGPVELAVESRTLGGRAVQEMELPEGGWHFFSCRFF